MLDGNTSMSSPTSATGCDSLGAKRSLVSILSILLSSYTISIGTRVDVPMMIVPNVVADMILDRSSLGSLSNTPFCFRNRNRPRKVGQVLLYSFEVRLVSLGVEACSLLSVSVFHLVKESVVDVQLSDLSKVVEHGGRDESTLLFVNGVFKSVVYGLNACHTANIQKEKAALGGSFRGL